MNSPPKKKIKEETNDSIVVKDTLENISEITSSVELDNLDGNNNKMDIDLTVKSDECIVNELCLTTTVEPPV